MRERNRCRKAGERENGIKNKEFVKDEKFTEDVKAG